MDAEAPKSVTTGDAATYWATRHRTYGPGWCEYYWDDWQAPHRTAFVDALRRIAPFDSLLEVGCGPGPNLRRFRAAFPDAMLYGIDLNVAAIEFAARQFVGDPAVSVRCLNVVIADADIVPPVDVVCTCYTLAYIAPDRIVDVLARLHRIARRVLVLAEPMGGWYGATGPVEGLSHPEWRHDYVSAIRRIAPTATLIGRRLDSPVDRLDGVLTWGAP